MQENNKLPETTSPTSVTKTSTALTLEATDNVLVSDLTIYGTLEGGFLMSHVDFEKWQCCMS